MRHDEDIDRNRALDFLDEMQILKRQAVALELAVIGAAREARLNSHGDALAHLEDPLTVSTQQHARIAPARSALPDEGSRRSPTCGRLHISPAKSLRCSLLPKVLTFFVSILEHL